MPSRLGAFISDVVRATLDWIGSQLSTVFDELCDYLMDIASVLGNKIAKLILHFALLCSLVSFIVLISVASYLFARSIIVPKALLDERLHFDFTSTPLARVDFLSEQRQWYYISNHDISTNDPISSLPQTAINKVSNTAGKRFLKYGNHYSIDVMLTLAKSPRNAHLGKCMMYLTTYDVGMQPIARSSRPITIPYQSAMTMYLDSIVLYPLRLLGYRDFPESDTILVNMMSKYLEPLARKLPTQYLEFTLSTADVDVSDVKLTVMPSLYGLA